MSRLRDDCIKVPINGLLDSIQWAMEEILELPIEKKQEYEFISPEALAAANQTLRRVEMYRGYDKALMDAGDANDMIFALVVAFLLEIRKHSEELKAHTATLKELVAVTTKARDYAEQHNEALDELIETKNKYLAEIEAHNELIEKYNQLCDDIDEYQDSVVGPLCEGAAIFCMEQGMDVPKEEYVENGKKMIAFSHTETAKVMNTLKDSMKNRTDLTASTLYRKANESPSVETWKEFIDYYEANTDLHDEESEYYKKYPMAEWRCSLLKDYYEEAKQQLAKLQHTEDTFADEDEMTEEESIQLLSDCGVPFLPDGTPIGIGED